MPKDPKVEEFLDDAEDPRDRTIEQLESEVADLQAELLRRGTTGHDSADPKTIVVIGDSHAEPEIPNDRYKWLGRLVTDVGADIVVDIGDWWSMDSLCKYDEGTRAFEGRRYWKDIDAGVFAQEVFSNELEGRGMAPKKIRTLGNHEYRIERITQLEPRFDGVVGLKDLRSEEFGWEEVPFLEPATIQGTTFSHYFTGPGGRPVSGVSPARAVLLKRHSSAVFGHTHRWDYSDDVTADGRRVVVLNVGCYFAQYMAWAGPADNRRYMRGITVLRNAKDGTFDFEFIGLDQIERKYGD